MEDDNENDPFLHHPVHTNIQIVPIAIIIIIIERILLKCLK